MNMKCLTLHLILIAVLLMIGSSAFAQTPSITPFTGNSWSVLGDAVTTVCGDDSDEHDNTDIDNDNDGLIEICYLEDLYDIRNNLSGGGTTEQGCRTGGCNGYELVRDLDFTVDGSYRNSGNNRASYTVSNFNDSNDMGWLPIANDTVPGTGQGREGHQGDSFTGIFEGNGHTIANLMINRKDTDYVGLIGSGGKIRNIGLLNVKIVGKNRIGSLTGRNEGPITNSYATGRVSGDDLVGGLSGENDPGVAGRNPGPVNNSYSTVSVTSVSRGGATRHKSMGY